MFPIVSGVRTPFRPEVYIYRACPAAWESLLLGSTPVTPQCSTGGQPRAQNAFPPAQAGGLGGDEEGGQGSLVDQPGFPG